MQATQMARIDGLPSERAGVLARVFYWMTKRQLGKLVEPITITAHHPRLLRAYGHMELGQHAAKTVHASLKALVQVKVAMLIGCPF